MGFRVQGSVVQQPEFVEGSEFWDCGFRWTRNTCVGFRVQSAGFRVKSSEFRVQVSECRIQSSGFRV